MKLHLSLVPFLLLHSVSAQRQQAAQGPEAKAHPAIVATRFLTEFQPATGFNGGARAHGDLDRDGDLDLVLLARRFLTDQPTLAQTWLNDGAGRFTSTHLVQIAEQNTAAQVALRLELVDLDSDGSLDLLYTRNEPFNRASLSGLFVAWGNGDGSFQDPIYLIQAPIHDFAVGDVEADGDVDLLVVRKPAGQEIGWYLNSPTGFVPGPQLPLGNEFLRSLRLVDLDDDQRLDAAALNDWTDDRVRTFRTQSDAALLEEPPIPLPPELADSLPQKDLLARDLEGDGDTDLLVVRFLPAEVFGNCFIYPLLATPGGFLHGDLQSTASLLYGGELFDWDKDGDLDFLTSGLEWFENTGGAHFVQAGSMAGITNMLVQAGDFDGDGNCDLISGWSFFAGNGSFPRKTSVQAPPYEAPLQPWRDDFADFEGDGDVDALAQLGRFENQGDGTFVPVPTPLPIVPGQIDVRSWGDFDGDGLRDLLVADFEEHFPPPFPFHSMQLLRGRERGDWERLPDPAALVEIPASSLVGDIDSDGDQDILVRDGYWENDGAGHFGSSARQVFAGQPFVAGDADRDGDLDLVVESAGRAVLLGNQGALSFSPLDLGDHAPNLIVDFLDLDSDGDLDLLVHSREQVALRERLPTGDYAAPLLLGQPAVAGTFGQLDIDADGRLDLVLVHRLGGGTTTILTAWSSRPGFTFGEHIDWVLGLSRDAVTPARVFTDIDGDGDRDIVGELLVENLTRDASEAGSAVQYSADAATSGSGAIHPILGASGPFAPHERCTFHLARARGGSQAWLFLGQGRARESVAGVEFLIGERRLLAPLTLSGPSGVAGAGAGQLDLRVPGGYFGRTFTFQAIVRDPGASGGFSATNGVEVRFGSAELRKP